MTEQQIRMISEINQLINNESNNGKKVKRWSATIIEKVNALSELKIPVKKISAETGIPHQTISRWKYIHLKKVQKPKSTFHELKVKANKKDNSPFKSESRILSTPTVAAQAPSPKPLNLKTPAGFIIEGLDENGVIALINRLSVGGTYAS